MRWSTITSLLASAVLCLAQRGPGAVTGSTNVHDPTICKDNAGKWWLFSTAPGIEIRSSTDRTNWQFVGKVFPNGASFTDAYTGSSNANLWAPDCTYVNGEFLLYFSASSFGSSKSAIFLLKSRTGLPNSFTNQGIVHESNANSNYNAIDPNLLIDGGNWYLTFGSFWSGIKRLQINPSTGKPTNNALTAVASRTAGGKAVEAPAVLKNGNFYYLFTSWDKCCSGTGSTYNIRVGRSSSATGAFVDKNNVALTAGGGTLVLGTHGNIIGPGGQDTYVDTDGPILVYHYYTPAGSFLGINRLDFSSGWPVVA